MHAQWVGVHYTALRPDAAMPLCTFAFLRGPWLCRALFAGKPVKMVNYNDRPSFAGACGVRKLFCSYFMF